jgi:hypothetical protein
MFRKLILAISATVTIGAAALTPTAASAHWHGGWHHGHYWHGYGFYGPTYVGGPDCYTVRRVVGTPWGRAFVAWWSATSA